MTRGLCVALRRATTVLLLVAVASTVPAAAQEILDVSAEPSIVIGASLSDPQDQLGRVLDATRLTDGSVVVLDALEPFVRIWDARGTFIRRVGRRGAGPGEFEDPVDIAQVADDLRIVDSRGWIATYSPVGDLVSTARVQPSGRGDEGFNTMVNRVLPDGSVLLIGPEGMFGRAEGEYRQRAALVRVDVDDRATFLAVLPADSGRTEGSSPPVPVPYLPSRGVLVDAGAPGVVAVDGRDEVVVFEYDGAVRSRFPAPLDAPPTADLDLTEARRTVLDRLTTPNDVRVVSEWLDLRPRAEHAPAVRSVLVDPGGRIWLEAWRRNGDRAVWTLVDPDGARLGEVRTPPGVRVVEVGDGWLLGVRVDELGVQTVVVHVLEAR